MTKPLSILMALALCGCSRSPDDLPSVSVGRENCSNTACLQRVEIDGIQCIVAGSQGSPIGGLSCDWIGYHQREPERQPPNIEAVKRCINALDPNSVNLATEIPACARQ